MEILERSEFPRLFESLRNSGYSVIGPKVHDGAIVYDELAADSDLPAGWTDSQEPGKYRLIQRSDRALFGFAVGPHSWKKYLHLFRKLLWRAVQSEDGRFELTQDEKQAPKLAFLGVRACELNAIFLQDKIFLSGLYQDSSYAARRKNIFLIAVHCTSPAATCFCASMKTGPRANSGFDLALTEMLEDGRHYFTVEAGSERGLEILQTLKCRKAEEAEIQRSAEALDSAEKKMTRSISSSTIKETLYRNYEHPRWNEVAKRCLNCGNCTMVCPTCFCTTVEDVTDLSGSQAERWRVWDSCFTTDFSYIHGGPVRGSAKSRYRQWMIHKLAAWFDQFGASGCVGCGRCITWCPAGIDITEEANAIGRGKETEQ